MLGERYANEVSDWRAVPEIGVDMSAAARNLLLDLIHNTDDFYRMTVPSDERKSALEELCKSGLVCYLRNPSDDHDAESQFGFACPLIRRAVLQQLYPANLKSAKPPYPSVQEFVIACVERFNNELLRDSKSHGEKLTAALLERVWQMEFYRSAVLCVPKGYTVSPDFGAMVGSKGFLDFFVNSELCYAIELLREGKAIAVRRRSPSSVASLRICFSVSRSRFLRWL